MKIEKISINGKLFSPDSARIPAADHGLMYGVNAFESLRVHDGKSFLLDEHFDRLKKSLDALGIAWDDDRSKYYSWIAELCAGLPDVKDAFVRFVVTAGAGDFWVSETSYNNPGVIIYRGHIPPYSPVAKRGIILAGVNRAKPEYFVKTGFRIKSMDYISSRMAKLELKKAGKGLDGILLTPEGYVAEGLTSNVFWIKDGKIHTPSLDTGILAGTVRAYLVANNDVNEVLVGPDELENAEEIFFTSGSSYLNPLSEINGIQKPGVSGPVFNSLYQQLTADIAEKSVAV
ncbi:MAG TPA: aminotransferase class IV [Candidatus Saccharimonadales bacterium]|nr:aminotransferase class IV [Candidatus Saccharimonadales bacterium]